VLLATNHLFGWTGSETLLLTLIEGLRAEGCDLTVYARHLDYKWASRQIGDGVQVTDNIEALHMCRFDLAHVQHSSCLLDVRAARPTLPILFSSLGVLPFLEQPIPFELGISRYLAISEEVAANLAAKGIDAQSIHIIRNLVSDKRFRPDDPIRERPERILVLSYKMDAARRELLRIAADRIGASIRFVGTTDEVIAQDQLVAVINTADVVVSLGRGVIEAMLCGRVPLVYDIHGGDGLVTPETIKEAWKNNFSGRRYRKEFTVDDLIAELSKYRQSFGTHLRDLALMKFGLSANLPRLLDIYAEVASSNVALTAEQRESIAFCSSLAREDLLQSRAHQAGERAALYEIHRIKHTVSWRITAPLRVVWNFCLRLVGRHPAAKRHSAG
jgi:hypothetical protein